MIVFRFMSNEEFEKYKAGEIIEGRRQKSESDSFGKYVICFMPIGGDITDMSEIECEPERAYEYLDGIVSDEICAVFQASDDIFEKGRGKYLNPYDVPAFMRVQEVYSPLYQKNDFTLLSYCKNAHCVWNKDDKWIWNREIT